MGLLCYEVTYLAPLFMAPVDITSVVFCSAFKHLLIISYIEGKCSKRK